MKVLAEFSRNPQECASRLLETCLCWVVGTVDQIRFTTGESDDVYPVRSELREGVVRAAMMDLNERVRKVARAKISKSARPLLGRLTNDFVRGRSDADVAEEFKSFVTALTCYHLLRQLEDPDERRQGAEYLLMSMGLPVEGASRATAYSHQLSQVEDEVLGNLSRKLVGEWKAAAPESFRDTLSTAVKRGIWKTIDLSRDRHREVRRAITARELLRRSPRETFDFVLDELLEVVFPFACRVAGTFPNGSGEALFLWLILGGVAHTKKSQERAESAPYLLQPSLIEAMIDRFGRDFVRDLYRRRVSHSFDADGGYWRAAREAFMAGLEPELDEDQLRALSDFIGLDPRLGLARVACAAGGLLALSARRPPAGETGGRSDQFTPPGDLGWRLFLELGEQTFRKIREGHLGALDRYAAELERASPSPPSLRRRLECSGDGQPADRERVAAAAKYLCEKVAPGANWTGTLDAWEGEA